MRRERLFLADIVDAADAVAAFLLNVDQATFLASDLVRSAVLHKLVVVGEAAARVEPATRALAPEIRWRSIVGFRNLVIHAYFDVDWTIVWETAQVDLPILRAEVAALLAVLPAGDEP